jgi:polysaccharide pyruvyl transferase WcaK-like protein
MRNLVSDVVIFAVPFSPNLGDGALNLAICQLLGELGIDRVESIDFSGRTDFVPAGKQVGLREHFISLSQYIPGALRRTLISKFVLAPSVKRQEGFWSDRVSQTQCCMIGGGNLLSDVDLIFPTRIRGVATVCQRWGKPLHFTLIGCGSRWSSRGRQLIQDVLNLDVFQSISFRDNKSRENFYNHFKIRPEQDLGVVADPAIALQPVSSGRESGTSRILGLNISDPQTLYYSGDLRIQSQREVHSQHYLQWAREAVASGWKIKIFTNGALEDENFAEIVFEMLKTYLPAGAVARHPRVVSPDALVSLIADCDAIAGFRLHANIIAYSQEVQALGLEWDSKVRGFYDLTGNPHGCLAFPNAAPTGFQEFLRRAADRTWIDYSQKASLLQDLRESVEKQVAAVVQLRK